MDENIIQTIRQKKLDCLAAKHLHSRSRAKLNRLNQAVDFLAISVPILYFVPRFVAKGTSYASRVEIGWEIIAAILIVLAGLKIAYHWEDRVQTHSKLLGENISLVRQADELLFRTGNIPETVQLFLRLAERSETADREAIGEPTLKQRQYAYREGLKELEPGNVSIVCPACNSSPWKFTRGSCQACGNTPNQR